MKRLNHILHYRELYIEGFALLLFVIGFSEPLCFILFVCYIFWQRKRIRWIYLSFFLMLIGGRFVLFHSFQHIDYINDTVKIVAIDYYETSERLTVSYNMHHYHIYVYQDIYELGDRIYVKGEIEDYQRATIPNGFNSYQYNLSQNVLGTINVESMAYVGPGFCIFKLRSWLINHVISNEKDVIKPFIFGKDQLTPTLREPLKQANLLFLLQTTGLHAYVLVLIIKRIMFYFNVNERNQSIVSVIIYAILCYLNAFALGVVRLLLSHMFIVLNKVFKWRYTALDRVFIVSFMMILIVFNWVYSVGFLMTILILLTLELARDRYQHYQGYLKRLVMGILIFFACLPFTSVVNPIVILCLPLLISFVTFIIYPLTFIASLTTRLDVLVVSLSNGLTFIVERLNQFNSQIYLPVLNQWQMFLYYGLFAYVLRAYLKKQLITRFVLLSSIFGYQYVNSHLINDATIYFLDVGQGDTTYIETRSCHAMIDSFEGSNDFLKSQGMNQLDLLFLTHSDSDHTKEAMDIIRDVGVNQIVINPYDKHYESYQTKVVLGKAHQAITCGNLSFQILGPLHAYEEANANSLVIAVQIESDHYLFTGDISQSVELDLVDAYGSSLKSDVLKIAHHGSDTSTSNKFIQTVQPKQAIIFAGRYNRFGFPMQTTLDVLHKYHVLIYRTDQMGTIKISYKSFRKLWETTLPISNDF